MGFNIGCSDVRILVHFLVTNLLIPSVPKRCIHIIIWNIYLVIKHHVSTRGTYCDLHLTDGTAIPCPMIHKKIMKSDCKIMCLSTMQNSHTDMTYLRCMSLKMGPLWICLWCEEDVEGSGHGLFSGTPQLSWSLLEGIEKSQENLTQVVQSLCQDMKLCRPTTLDHDLVMKLHEFQFCVVNSLLILGRIMNILIYSVWANYRVH